MKSQFAFLGREWPDIYAAAAHAEAAAKAEPRTSCFYARRTVELAVHWLYDADRSLHRPYKDDLSAMLFEPTFQAAVDKKLSDDPAISPLGITASVLNGKVMLLGTVKTEALKAQIEKMVKQVKGVKEVDNQISVIAE